MYLNAPGPKSVSGFLKATGGGVAAGAVLGAPMGAVSKITGQACFTADTQVLMADGTSKPIQDIVVGDEVVAWNHATGTNEAKRVVETFTHDEVETWEVATTQGVLTSTAEHPFYVEGRGWTPVKDLHPGDRIATNTGQAVTVERVEATGQAARVYNFHVADLHNYHVAVGNHWTRVHNSCNVSANRANGKAAEAAIAARYPGSVLDGPGFPLHTGTDLLCSDTSWYGDRVQGWAHIAVSLRRTTNPERQVLVVAER